jgi:hypothetical protein
MFGLFGGRVCWNAIRLKCWEAGKSCSELEGLKCWKDWNKLTGVGSVRRNQMYSVWRLRLCKTGILFGFVLKAVISNYFIKSRPFWMAGSSEAKKQQNGKF